MLRAVHSTLGEVNADLMVVGSDSSGDLSSISDELVSIARTSPVPVLVVPSNARYQGVAKALVPCDFSSVSGITLLKNLRKLDPIDMDLIVLNVDPNEKQIQKQEETSLQIKELLENCHYQVRYATDKNVVKGILNFAAAEGVQLIIALPGEHSFFYRITHSSITEGLTLNSTQPVLIMK